MKICELNPSVRPYERLEEFGPESLSDEELLAIVLRSGTKGLSSKEIASQLISSENMPEGLVGLVRMSLPELSQFNGVGRVKAIVIQASLELGRRAYSAFGAREKVQFLSCDVAKSFFESQMSFLESEEFRAAYLDTRCRLICSEVLCRGGLNQVQFNLKEVFRTAVRCNAAGIIVAHNHPSGDPTPGSEDIDATKQLMESGRMLGIDVLDHVIVGRGVSISLKEEGFMEEEI